MKIAISLSQLLLELNTILCSLFSKPFQNPNYLPGRHWGCKGTGPSTSVFQEQFCPPLERDCPPSWIPPTCHIIPTSFCGENIRCTLLATFKYILQYFPKRHKHGQQVNEKVLTNHQGNANQNHMSYHLLPDEMAPFKKTRDKCGKNPGELLVGM